MPHRQIIPIILPKAIVLDDKAAAVREKLGNERGIVWSFCCNAITANTLGNFAYGEALAM